MENPCFCKLSADSIFFSLEDEWFRVKLGESTTLLMGSPVSGCLNKGESFTDCSTSMYSGGSLWFNTRYLKTGIGGELGRLLFFGRKFEAYGSIILEEEVCIKTSFRPSRNEAFDQTSFLFTD